MPGDGRRVVVLTGASSGLGAALARRYARPGTTLGLIARDRTRLDAVADDCRASGAAVETAILDVVDPEPLSAWLLTFDDAHPVDVVVANAGTSAGVAPGAASEGLASVTRQVAVNLLGAANTLEPLLPRLAARKRGSIGLVSSIAGLRGLPYSPGYSASKAGLRAYGEALRPLLRPVGVRVTVVCPGFFDTPMTDRWRGDTPFLWSVERTAATVEKAITAGAARKSFPWPLVSALKLADIAPPWIVDPILRGFHFHIVDR